MSLLVYHFFSTLPQYIIHICSYKIVDRMNFTSHSHPSWEEEYGRENIFDIARDGGGESSKLSCVQTIFPCTSLHLDAACALRHLHQLSPFLFFLDALLAYIFFVYTLICHLVLFLLLFLLRFCRTFLLLIGCKGYSGEGCSLNF